MSDNFMQSEQQTETRQFEEVEPEAEVVPDTEKQPRDIRMGTIVWGLVVITLGVLLILWSRGASIEPQVAAISVLFGAGALLIIGSLISAFRGRKTTRGGPGVK